MLNRFGRIIIQSQQICSIFPVLITHQPHISHEEAAHPTVKHPKQTKGREESEGDRGDLEKDVGWRGCIQKDLPPRCNLRFEFWGMNSWVLRCSTSRRPVKESRRPGKPRKGVLQISGQI